METLVNETWKLQEVLNSISMENTCLDFQWHFEVSDGYDAGWLVNVALERPDTHSGIIGIGRSRKEYIEYNATESCVVKTCWLLIELTVRHELMEAFKWKGKRIFNPHNTVEQLASLQD